MIGLCYDKTHGTMANYDDGYGDRDDDGNEERNYDVNATSESGSDGPIFDPIMTPRYCGRGSGDDVDGAADATKYICTCRNIYLPYKGPIKNVP